MNEDQTSTPNSPQSDYGTNQDWLKKVDHEADMKDIRDRLEKLEQSSEKLETRTKDNPAMVVTITDLLEHDRNIDPVMTAYIRDHIDLKPFVKDAVDNLDKRLVKAFMKKTGIWVLGAIWSIVLIFATAWITVTVTNANTPKAPAAAMRPSPNVASLRL